MFLFWVGRREARSCSCFPALLKSPESCSACEGSLAFPYCKELAACTLPLLFPIDRKDDLRFTRQNCQALECYIEVSLFLFLHRGSGLALSLLHSQLCVCVLINEISLRAHLKRDVCWCVWGVTRVLLLNGCSSNSLLLTFARSRVMSIGIQLRKWSLAFLTRLPLQLLCVRCNGYWGWLMPNAIFHWFFLVLLQLPRPIDTLNCHLLLNFN